MSENKSTIDKKCRTLNDSKLFVSTYGKLERQHDHALTYDLDKLCFILASNGYAFFKYIKASTVDDPMFLIQPNSNYPCEQYHLGDMLNMLAYFMKYDQLLQDHEYHYNKVNTSRCVGTIRYREHASDNWKNVTIKLGSTYAESIKTLDKLFHLGINVSIKYQKYEAQLLNNLLKKNNIKIQS